MSEPSGATNVISTNWGVLVAKHGKLKLVSALLADYGVDHFIPRFENLRIVNRRHIRERVPYLGDYVPFAVSASWKSLLGVKGVAGILLNADGYPARVLPSELATLRDLDENGVTVEVGSDLVYGQRVLASAGPLAGHYGYFDGKTRRGAAALFMLFGREQRVVFKQGELVKA